MESTRATFAHEAVLHVDAGTDEREPGAVITIELCGAIDAAPWPPVAALSLPPQPATARKEPASKAARETLI